MISGDYISVEFVHSGKISAVLLIVWLFSRGLFVSCCYVVGAIVGWVTRIILFTYVGLFSQNDDKIAFFTCVYVCRENIWT